MLGSIIIILITSFVVGWLFEKLNQSKLEPFEKIQAKTRYIRKKKVWQYSILLASVSVICWIGFATGIQQIFIDLLLGIVIAVIDVIFENTIFDQMRNTLR